MLFSPWLVVAMGQSFIVGEAFGADELAISGQSVQHAVTPRLIVGAKSKAKVEIASTRPHREQRIRTRSNYPVRKSILFWGARKVNAMGLHLQAAGPLGKLYPHGD